LSSCKTALTQGRFRWRHDQVLRELADVLERERARKGHPTKVNSINFVRPGEKGKAAPHQGGILDGAQLWEMRVDLDRRLSYPDIIQTSLRPDIVLWSVQSKRMVMVELTVPWEKCCEEAYQRKKMKYASIAEEVRALGWSAWVFPVEMGSRGFPAQSMWKMFSALGITGVKRRTAVMHLSRTAERASSWLWWKRGDSSWKQSTGGQ